MLSRILNTLIFLTIPFCIYITFSVKNDVYEMQKQKKELERKIQVQSDKIALYQVELIHLSSAQNILSLREKLMPEYEIADIDNIISDDHLKVASNIKDNKPIFSKIQKAHFNADFYE